MVEAIGVARASRQDSCIQLRMRPKNIYACVDVAGRYWAYPAQHSMEEVAAGQNPEFQKHSLGSRGLRLLFTDRLIR